VTISLLSAEVKSEPMAVVEQRGSEEAGESASERLVTIFSALSDPTRIEMIQMLVRTGEIGCSAFDEHFPLSKSTISYHTKILHAAGLISTRREGRLFFYEPIVETIEHELPGLVERLRKG
jgi:DNA-binding transcriptional ArsR family regulator